MQIYVYVCEKTRVTCVYTCIGLFRKSTGRFCANMHIHTQRFCAKYTYIHNIHILTGPGADYSRKIYTATHCNTPKHATAHCHTLPHTATHCHTLPHTASHRTRRNTHYHRVRGQCTQYQIPTPLPLMHVIHLKIPRPLPSFTCISATTPNPPFLSFNPPSLP